MLLIRSLAISRSALLNNGVRTCTKVVQPRPLLVSRASYHISAFHCNKYGDNFGSSSYDDYGSDRQWTPVVRKERKAPDVVSRKLSVKYESGLPGGTINKWRSENDITVEGQTECPDPILTFAESPFSDIAKMKLGRLYDAPLPIQSQGWSVAMSGVNMVGCADTGSGKTVAFLLPALEHIMLQGQGGQSTARVLIMAPTRELAQQIEIETRKFAGAYRVNVACLFGGQGNRGNQMGQIRRGPQLIIATPGRLLDFVQQGVLEIGAVNFLVLDEADRMMDMGFETELREVLSIIPAERQTCMWTATWPKSIQKLTRDYFGKYVRVNVGSMGLSANPNVKQIIEVTSERERLTRLHQIMKEYDGQKILIFVGTKRGCEAVGASLFNSGLRNVASLHGDKSQPQRESILRDFKGNQLRVVVATDVAARGLDVADIELIINYDFPSTVENYIHRIGRTARGGKTGTSLSFFTPVDFRLTKELIELLRITKQEVPEELSGALKREDAIKESQKLFKSFQKRRRGGNFRDASSMFQGGQGGQNRGKRVGGGGGGGGGGGRKGGSNKGGSSKGSAFDFEW